MRTRLVVAALAATFAIAAAPGLTQTQPAQTNQPALSDEKGKAQQNSADEAAPKGDLEAAKDSGDQAKMQESAKKLEDAAEKTKQKIDGAGGTTGAAKPQ